MTASILPSVAAGSRPGSSWLGRPSPGPIGWAERGLVPDVLVRAGIRGLLRQRLRDLAAGGVDAADRRQHDLRNDLWTGPVAVATEAANRQHYEVPPAFFDLVLGPHRKYSSCLYRRGDETLGEAEAAMLDLTCQRADLKDGQTILELGCGWGSLTLWMAKAYPKARITAVSNSAAQRSAILARASGQGLTNIEVITADLAHFRTAARFDRVVSVECLEHFRNHRELFRRISAWLTDQGRCFIHVFTHRDQTYLFEDQGDGDWMSRHFFTGGMMPADAHFLHLQEHLRLEEHWRVSGRHYRQTAEHWLENLDARREACIAALEADGLDRASARLQVSRWRIFFMACAELWGFARGEEWLVSHYRFTRQ